nr:unnamed protein product [Callosobruchus chinensis]
MYLIDFRGFMNHMKDESGRLPLENRCVHLDFDGWRIERQRQSMGICKKSLSVVLKRRAKLTGRSRNCPPSSKTKSSTVCFTFAGGGRNLLSSNLNRPLLGRQHSSSNDRAKLASRMKKEYVKMEKNSMPKNPWLGIMKILHRSNSRECTLVGLWVIWCQEEELPGMHVGRPMGHLVPDDTDLENQAISRMRSGMYEITLRGGEDA